MSTIALTTETRAGAAPPRAAGRGAWRAALAAVLVLALPYLGFLGSHQLWQPYEPDLVETAREMRASGDLVVPTLDGATYAEKPPLYYWAAVSCAALRGRLDETAARLPSALSALALVLVTALLGARLFGPGAGFLAGIVLGTQPLFFQCGTAGMCDMPLALATTGAYAALWLALCEERPRGGYLVLAGALAGVALLAKSLLGPGLIALAALPAVLARRPRRLPHAAWWALAAAAFSLVVAPWYVAVAAREGWPFLSELLLRQTIGRFFGADEAKGSVFKYLGSVPLDMLPWTIFAPLVALDARRARAEEPARWERLRALLAGAGVVIVFLSLSACRINKYALPVSPLLALALGAALDAARGEAGRRLVAAPVALLAALCALGAAAVPALVAWRAPSLVEATLPLSAFALLGGAALYVVSRTAAPRSVAFALAVFLSGGAACAQLSLYPRVDEIRGDRPLEAAIRTFVKADTPYACYGLYVRAYIIFYTERTYVLMGTRAELDRWLATVGARTAYMLTREDILQGLSADPLLARRFSVVGQNPPGVGHDDYVLVRISH